MQINRQILPLLWVVNIPLAISKRVWYCVVLTERRMHSGK